MRRSGKTTRRIDDAIQVLFTHGEIIIPSKEEQIDYEYRGEAEKIITDPDSHFYNYRTYKDEIFNEINMDLLRRIRRRLNIEHNLDLEKKGGHKYILKQ